MLPVMCIDGAEMARLAECVSLTETEAAYRGSTHLGSRLATGPTSFEGVVQVRLHFHARGGVRNLYIEPQPPLELVEGAEVPMHVRAVGLNFRDVLNVLGEYPGDPGPPGGDAAGVVSTVDAAGLHAVGEAAFGLGDAPLASLACAAAPSSRASRRRSPSRRRARYP